MTRTQIQLPDDVYARARQVCKSREISLAELARRGLEYIYSIYASGSVSPAEWQAPKPRRLGWKGLTDAEIKEQAQFTAPEVSFAGRRKR